MVTVPASLLDPELRPVWESVRRRLERSGIDNRGRIRLPALSARSRHVLTSLTGRPVSSTLALDALESGLARLGVAADLAEALSRLGEPVSQEPARRRAARAEAEAARREARRRVGHWPEEWAPRWIEETIRAGLLAGMGPDESAQLVETVRRLLDALPGSGDPPVSRVDLAARVAGSAHALDAGSRLTTATARALHHMFPDPEADPWEQAGIQPDLVSGAALTWGLRARPGTELAPLLSAGADLAIPLHVSQFTLRRHRLQPPAGTDVLVVENPRLVEAAAQRRVGHPVVATNGQPSGAVWLLLDQLQEGGAGLRYHGDFDPAGLAIAARMYARRITPWRMDADEYRRAVEASAVALPASQHPSGPTPWEPALQEEFNRRRRVVHQELLLDRILGKGGDGRGRPSSEEGDPFQARPR